MFASVILESVTLCVLAGDSELVVRADLVQVRQSVIPTLCAQNTLLVMRAVSR